MTILEILSESHGMLAADIAELSRMLIKNDGFLPTAIIQGKTAMSCSHITRFFCICTLKKTEHLYNKNETKTTEGEKIKPK